MRIILLTGQLGLGGAERQLVELAKALHQHGEQVSVVVFYGQGALDDELSEAGIPLISIEKKGRWDWFGTFRRLRAVVREIQPDVLHSYLTTPNIMAGLLKFFAPNVQVVFGVRNTSVPHEKNQLYRRFVDACETRLAKRANLSVSNSEAGRNDVIARGFPAKRTIVIPNGIDIERFQPDEQRRKRAREALNLQPDQPLIGLIGRLEPQKQHPLFLQAAALVAQRQPQARFLCLGRSTPERLNELKSLTDQLGLSGRLQWLEPRNDIETIMSALDILCLPSSAEGFPNVVAEAMACGVPCVVTNVGDSAKLVGDLGLVVEPGDVQGLASAFETMLASVVDENWPKKAVLLRQRIVQNYTIEKLLFRSLHAYRGLLSSLSK